MSSSSGGSGGGGATSSSNSNSSRFDQILDSIIKPFKFFHHPASSVTGKGHHHLETELEVAIAAQEQKIFSLQTLMTATRKFHQENLLGQGGFGPVYKGKLKDGREIAVKKLSRASTQGKREFINEARLLSRVQHRNVVNLVGYCAEGVEKLLVYEYVVNESLDKLLFDDDRRHELDWVKRFGVIVGVARGLLYLHQDAHCIIIHRDIKAGNILLDERWKPKISDFGMARLFPEDQTHVHTRVAGTNGYMAPEYLMHGQLSDKADVFSFGMVVLELISGKKNSSFVPLPEAKSLAEWAWKLHKAHRSLEMMDPALASSATPEQIQYCIHIGLLCVQADPKMRPGMNRVVNLLSKKPGNLDEPTKPGFPGSRYRPRRSERGSSSYGVFTASQSGDASSSSNSSTARTSSSVTSNQAGCEMPSGIDTSSTTRLSNSRTMVSGTSSLTQPSTFGSRATRIEPLSPEHSGGSGSYSAGPSTSTSRTRSDPELTTHIGDTVDPIRLSISNKTSCDP